MFNVARVPRFTHDVPVMTPVDGGHTEESLKVTYNFLTTEETAVYDLNSPEGTTRFLRRAIHKLDDLVDQGGQPVAYNDGLRDQLIMMPNVRQALCKGYFDAVLAAKKGN